MNLSADEENLPEQGGTWLDVDTRTMWQPYINLLLKTGILEISQDGKKMRFINLKP